MKRILVAGIVSVFVLGAQTTTLFQENFAVQGDSLDRAKWTTEVGAASFLGRTQLADWITQPPTGKFVVGPNGAQLTLQTYNPTGASLFGTHAKTIAAFQPTASTAIVLRARMRLTSIRRGIVFGIYFYGCVPGNCASQHDEIDIELVTNFLQAGRPTYSVQLNRYANEPLGAGNGVVADLPAGFDPLAVHEWAIRWSLTAIDYYLDGILLFSTATHVPQGLMQANVIAWAPAVDWAAAYDQTLQYVTSAALNEAHTALLTSVTVQSVPATPLHVGVFRSGFLWLEDVDGNRQFTVPPDRVIAFGGVPGDIPIGGDWNGSGTAKVGIYRSSSGIFLLDYNGDGQFSLPADRVLDLGVGTQPGDLPVIGDWNGDGTAKVGLFRQGFLWILDSNGNGVFQQGVDQAIAFGGVPGDVPVAGDWNGSAKTKIGLFRQGFFWILDYNGNGVLDGVNAAGGDKAFAFGGIAGDVPLVADWNGNGKAKPGVFRAGFFWVLDANGNYQFDGTGAGQDLAFPFGGVAGDKPVTGRW